LTPRCATKSLKLLHIRKSGSDMIGSIGSRGETFNGYKDSMSGSDEDDDVEIEDDEDLEDDIEAQTSENRAPTGIIIDGLSSRAPASQSSMSDADLEDMQELVNLPGSLLSFAKWAFGADGIPSLQVIAYGDFSFGTRFKLQSHIICRQAFTFSKRKQAEAPGTSETIQLPFRPIRDSDIKMMELVNENMDFLGACPVDHLMAIND
jgi:hypothetical protein